MSGKLVLPDHIEKTDRLSAIENAVNNQASALVQIVEVLRSHKATILELTDILEAHAVRLKKLEKKRANTKDFPKAQEEKPEAEDETGTTDQEGRRATVGEEQVDGREAHDAEWKDDEGQHGVDDGSLRKEEEKEE